MREINKQYLVYCPTYLSRWMLATFDGERWMEDSDTEQELPEPERIEDVPIL